jgi:bacterial/archaeal transporter family protein
MQLNWIPLALLTALAFGLYNFCIKLASGSINQIAGAVILQVVAAALGGLLLLYIKLTNQPVYFSSRGIYFSCLAGFFVGLAEILTFYVFARGVPAAIGTPVIIGGSVVATALLGVLVLKEYLAPVQVLAVVLIVAGVALLVNHE